MRRETPVAVAARRSGTTLRMARYRERLGLVRPARTPGGHRTYGQADVAALVLADRLERRYGVGPAALAFGLRVVAEPGVAADLRLLAVLAGHLPGSPVAALDFEQRKAERLLGVPTPADRGAHPR